MNGHTQKTPHMNEYIRSNIQCLRRFASQNITGFVFTAYMYFNVFTITHKSHGIHNQNPTISNHHSTTPDHLLRCCTISCSVPSDSVSWFHVENQILVLWSLLKNNVSKSVNAQIILVVCMVCIQYKNWGAATVIRVDITVKVTHKRSVYTFIASWRQLSI